MKVIILLIFFLIVAILYVVVRRYKQEESERIEKSKQLVQNIIDKIPKKMQKVIVKSKDTFPAGMIKLASTVAETKPGTTTKQDKMIEAFEDIKDIRYGKIGASNMKDGITINKWIKVASFTISGAWQAKGLTLEAYPRLRNHTSSRQTLVSLVRNLDADVEAPYISLNTHNEFAPGTRLIKDVRLIRTSGSGITSNVMELWIQFDCNWTDTTYVMYYLYNFSTNDFVATVPQAQVDNPPAGQAWGISERIEPQNGKTTITGSKGSGWGTAINVNAPQQPESLYSLHFGDGSDLHGRQAGMGYIKDQPNRIWGPTRGTLGMHIHQDDDLHLYSSGWTPLFSVKGGSGDTYVKGTLSAMGGANLEGRIRFRHAGANGSDDSDPYYLEKVRTSGNNNSLRLTINDDADESFQIWADSCREPGSCEGPGNSCSEAACKGPGGVRHHFQANGKTQHITDDGDANSEQLVIGRTDRSNLRLGKTADYSWIQSHGSKPLLINPIGNDVKFNKIILGDKFSMSGVGDGHANDYWLRLMRPDGGDYYGGLAAGRLYTAEGGLAGSDRKMKENISKVEQKDMLAKISKLNGYVYNLKNDKDKKKKYGVIAQELQKEFPEMVEKGPNGLLAVDYNQLIAVLLETVKELNKKCSKKENN